MRLFIAAAAALCVAAFVAEPALAQDGAVEGRVRDNEGSAVYAVSVQVLQAGGPGSLPRVWFHSAHARAHNWLTVCRETWPVDETGRYQAGAVRPARNCRPMTSDTLHLLNAFRKGDVLAGFDRGFELLGAEVRRRG